MTFERAAGHRPAVRGLAGPNAWLESDLGGSFSHSGFMNGSLENRVALVTGASRGLGAAIARGLAERGAKVAVNYFANRQRAEALCADIRATGGVAECFGADVRDEAAVTRLTAEVESKLGPIDVLVLNATGPQPFVKIEDLTWRACLDQLEFFVKSPVLLAAAVVPGMKRRKRGRIVHVGSEVFEKGVPEFSNYVAAKGAQLGLVRSWAMELAPWGITVNMVSPGWIPTERHAGDSQAAKDAYAAAVPMRHMGEARDVAEAVAYLASDAAKFVTGQRLSVNGGNTLM
jgi:NAD(P)-dependent dehydrogenase (short-subunit alcohol dehydrogenase family)